MPGWPSTDGGVVSPPPVANNCSMPPRRAGLSFEIGREDKSRTAGEPCPLASNVNTPGVTACTGIESILEETPRYWYWRFVLPDTAKGTTALTCPARE